MDLYIKGVPAAGTSRSTAKLMKTGQTTSYRTGDDGDLEAGRNVDFFILAENNPFGNTNRFTDELGGQTYTNNIVIDWSTYDGSTVLGWRRTPTQTVTWEQAIDGALLVSIGTFTTGWRLPNISELFSICNWQSDFRYLYSPFNIANVLFIWSSTTNIQSTSRALIFGPTMSTAIQHQTKTVNTSMGYIPCRTFTVTGTTLS